LSYPLLFYRLADRDLVSSHEARAAQDAQTILLDDAWGSPALFDRKTELQKPPLYYWLVALIGRLTAGQVDALAVRLPATLAALGGAFVILALGILRGRPWAGFVAAAALLTMVRYTWLGRVGRIDMPLTLATAAALTSFYQVYRKNQDASGTACWRWLLVMYLAIAVAALLKGPIGVVLPLGVIACLLLVEKRLLAPWNIKSWWHLVQSYGLWWGMILIILVAGPGFVWLNAKTGGEFFQVFFWKHNIQRGFGGGTLAAHPWWFYGPRLVIDLAPWSLLLPLTVWWYFRKGWWWDDPEARFGLVWLAAILVVLSLSRFKRADYLLPAFPGAALFLGCAIERWWPTTTRKRLLASLVGGLGLVSILGWGAFLIFVEPVRAGDHDQNHFAREIRRRAPAPQLILFFRTENHTLAFHTGRPIDTILEWENLDSWAARPEIYYVVMPSQYAAQWRDHLKKGSLLEVMKSQVLGGSAHADPLVLLRTHPEAAPFPEQ
jgi:4-amino-4-deoxy-L-arabinose transferase-like glycosyltransferase